MAEVPCFLFYRDFIEIFNEAMRYCNTILHGFLCIQRAKHAVRDIQRAKHAVLVITEELVSDACICRRGIRL